MGLRQTMNENPGITTAVTAGIVVIAIAFIVYQIVGGGSSSGSNIPQKSFFSDDDGKTYFIDDAIKVPPFDHNGKPAYRVAVYRCGDNGKPFVSRLEGYDPADKQKIEDTIKNGASATSAGSFGGFTSGLKVKKPGETNKWAKLKPNDPRSAEAFQKVMQPRCPDGSIENIRSVRVDDSNTGAVSG